jgi:hypothetical protein
MPGTTFKTSLNKNLPDPKILKAMTRVWVNSDSDQKLTLKH